VAVIVNGAATALLVRRLGGVRHLVELSRAREGAGAYAIGTNLPSIRCRDLRYGEERHLHVKLAPGTLAFIVRPNSVSAHRVVRLVNRMARWTRPPVPVVWIVVSDRSAAERFIRETGIRQRALSCTPAALDLTPRSLDSPLGLLVGDGGMVSARGFVDGAPSLARFLEACPEPGIRAWLVETLYAHPAEFRDALTPRPADEREDAFTTGAGNRSSSSP